MLLELGALCLLGLVWTHRARRNLARRRDDLVQTIRQRRAVASSSAAPVRAACRDDAALTTALVLADEDQRALVGCGFQPLGDLVLELSQTQAVAMRAFVAADGTCAYLAVPRSGMTRLLLFCTATEVAMFTTIRGRGYRDLSRAPFDHQQEIASATPEHVLSKHRPFAISDHPPRRVTDLAELVLELGRQHAMCASWRLTQPVDALLDADLRAFLGRKYNRRPAWWRQRIVAADLPTATVTKN
jgi:hypothetical protein